MRHKENLANSSAFLHAIDEDEEVERRTHQSVECRGALTEPPDGFQIVQENADLDEPDENDLSLVLCIYIAHYALRHVTNGTLQECRCQMYHAGRQFAWLHENAQRRLGKALRLKDRRAA